jgi:DNA-binding transcriptional regulator YiaG
MNTKNPRGNKPFPWICPACGKTSVRESTVSHIVTGQHDNRPYKFTVDRLVAPQCTECKEVVFDRSVNAQISDAIRRHLKVMSPDEIRRALTGRCITQRQLADALDIAPETISRWMTGLIIQSRSNDRRLRKYFKHAQEADAPAEDFAAAWSARVESSREMQEIVCREKSAWCFGYAGTS